MTPAQAHSSLHPGDIVALSSAFIQRIRKDAGIELPRCKGSVVSINGRSAVVRLDRPIADTAYGCKTLPISALVKARPR